VRLFRRREPLHVQLAREGGLELEEPRTRPAWDASGIHGLHRPREWDAVVTVAAPEVEGTRATFVALPDGAVVVEEGPTTLAPCALAGSTASCGRSMLPRSSLLGPPQVPETRTARPRAAAGTL